MDATPVERVIERVLLVDDEPDIRKVAELALRAIGKWKVTMAASGEEALRVVDEAKPDVILLDASMPGMDGIETFARLRDLPVCTGVPVIFLTGRSDDAARRKFLALGAAGVLAKPFDPMKLAEDVRRAAAAGVAKP